MDDITGSQRSVLLFCSNTMYNRLSCGFHNDSLFVYNVDSEKKGCIRKRSKGVIGCYICGIGSQYSNLVFCKGTWIVGAVCIETDGMA